MVQKQEHPMSAAIDSSTPRDNEQCQVAINRRWMEETEVPVENPQKHPEVDSHPGPP